MFVGRGFELEQLHRLYQSKNSQIAVIYGRRRIGKSALIHEFSKKLPHLCFEGIEGATTPEQIRQFTVDLVRQIKDPLLSAAKFERWEQVFEYLTHYISSCKKKLVLFLDEVQWMAANQSLFISLLKKYWDTHWKSHKLMLILCGSVSSYMVKRVIKSNALYGRIDFELNLGPLPPQDALQLLKSKRSNDEVFQYLLLLGGIPKYLELLDPAKSLTQNMNTLAFMKTSVLATEYERIFYSQFREHQNYERIIQLLTNGPANLQEIGRQLKLPSGGGLKSYVENLENALFITGYHPFDKTGPSKLKKYKLTDEYLRFYFKFIRPNLNIIKENTRNNLFKSLVTDQWEPWLGIAFENFCLKNAMLIARKLGFHDQVTSFGPMFSRGSKGFQIDLLYLRNDRTITLCEIKYWDAEIPSAIIPEVESKCALLTLPRGYSLEKALISRFGPARSLANKHYFQHSMVVNDFFT